MDLLILGFTSGLALIVAIGSQNAFVIRKGINKTHIKTVIVICSLSDALLSGLGIFGFHQFVILYPEFTQFVKIGGILFMVLYALLCFRHAFTMKEGLKNDAEKSQTRKKYIITVFTTLAVTYLNPHVYLDTVVFIGSLSTNFDYTGKLVFWLGVCLSSLLWFSVIGFGAKLMSRLLSKPFMWQVIQISTGVIMMYFAFRLFQEL